MNFQDFLHKAVAGIDPEQMMNRAGPDDSAPITVTGSPMRTQQEPSFGVKFPDAPDPAPLSNGPPGRDLGNRSQAEAAMAARENNPEHKGAFGQKGTLRNIMGTIGDAFLVQSGNKTRYKDKRHQEDMGDAMAGFTDHPLDAIERLAQVDPEAADTIYKEYMTNKQHTATLESQDRYRQSAMQNTLADNIIAGHRIAAPWIAAAQDDPNKLPLVADQITRLAKSIGADPSVFGLNPDGSIDPARAQMLGDGGMTVNQQQMLPRRDRQLDISQQNADNGSSQATSSRIRANRPPAGRNPPQKQDRDAYIEIMNKPANQRTAGEAAWAERFRDGTRGNSKSGRRSVSPDKPSGGNRVVLRGRTFGKP